MLAFCPQAMTNPFSSRLVYAARWSVGHLLLSLGVAAASAVVVFGLWYPAPWRLMLGLGGIFLLVVVVDVVCGPLLTLVLSNPRKSRRERWFDLSLIGFIQLAALAYGLHSVYSARPVLLVFDVDRFVVVTANEVQTEQLDQAPEGLRKLSLSGVGMVGLRQPVSNEEYLKSLELSLSGVPQPMRPGWWRPYDEIVRAEVVAKSAPLVELMETRPSQRGLLDEAAKRTGVPVESLRYLPLASSKTLSWTALLTDTGSLVGYAEVDAFR